MMRRPRRSLPATLVALVVLAGAALVATSCIQVLLGRRPLLPWHTVARAGASLTWTAGPVVVLAIVAAGLGLVLVAAALLPGRATVLALVSSPTNTRAGIARNSLRRDLASTAGQADGITAARISVTRRRIRAQVRAAGGTSSELGEHVHRLLTQRLDALALAHRPRLRVRVHADRRS